MLVTIPIGFGVAGALCALLPGGGEKSKPNAVSTDFYPYLCALKQIHETHQRLQKTLSD